MTTLFKSVGAARESLRYLRGVCQGLEHYDYDQKKVEESYHLILSTLPTKPLSEEEIKHLCFEEVLGRDYGAMNPVLAIELTIRALRDAGVLFVSEGDEGVGL